MALYACDNTREEIAREIYGEKNLSSGLFFGEELTGKRYEETFWKVEMSHILIMV